MTTASSSISTSMKMKPRIFSPNKMLQKKGISLMARLYMTDILEKTSWNSYILIEDEKKGTYG